MSDYESRRIARERAREAAFNKIGALNPDVLSRLVPIRSTGDGPELYYWPGHVLGAIRIIDLPQSVLLVTDGMSDPWHPELHPEQPEMTFDLELALEVPKSELADSSGTGIAGSWLPTFMWALTDWVVAERLDIKSKLIRFDCITLAVPPVEGLEKLVAANGCIGVLTGIPFAGDSLRAQAVLTPLDDEDAVWMAGAKILTPDEYEWAMAVQDSSRTRALAEVFLRNGQRNASWPDRMSILPDLIASSVACRD